MHFLKNHSPIHYFVFHFFYLIHFTRYCWAIPPRSLSRCFSWRKHFYYLRFFNRGILIFSTIHINVVIVIVIIVFNFFFFIVFIVVIKVSFYIKLIFALIAQPTSTRRVIICFIFINIFTTFLGMLTFWREQVLSKVITAPQKNSFLCLPFLPTTPSNENKDW